MNINKYVSINSSLFVIGLYSNITIVISIFSIYHALKLIMNSFKCGVCLNINIVSIVVMFLMLDFFDVVRFIFENSLICNFKYCILETYSNATSKGIT